MGRRLRAQQLEGDKLGHCRTNRKVRLCTNGLESKLFPEGCWRLLGILDAEMSLCMAIAISISSGSREEMLKVSFVKKWKSRSKSRNKCMEVDSTN